MLQWLWLFLLLKACVIATNKAWAWRSQESRSIPHAKDHAACETASKGDRLLGEREACIRLSWRASPTRTRSHNLQLSQPQRGVASRHVVPKQHALLCCVGPAHVATVTATCLPGKHGTRKPGPWRNDFASPPLRATSAFLTWTHHALDPLRDLPGVTRLTLCPSARGGSDTYPADLEAAVATWILTA